MYVTKSPHFNIHGKNMMNHLGFKKLVYKPHFLFQVIETMTIKNSSCVQYVIIPHNLAYM